MFCIDYDEFNASSYRGIYTHGTDKNGSKSYTGNPIKDYKNVHNWANKDCKERIAISSTFDNFLMDSKKYDYVFDKNHGVIGLKLTKSKKKKKNK